MLSSYVISMVLHAHFGLLTTVMQVSSMRNQRFTLRSCFQHMLSEGGVRSLWRGNGVNVVKIVPESALRFFTYEHVRQLKKEYVQLFAEVCK